MCIRDRYRVYHSILRTTLSPSVPSNLSPRQPLKTSTNIPKASGIYRISIGPRTFYFGQAQDLYGREASHRSQLRAGKHNNRRLQNSFDKHGEGAYTFEVSLLCPVEDLNMQEQFAIDIYHGTPGCANIAMVAEATQRGLRRSEADKAKMSEALMGVTKTAEHAEALRAGQRALHPNILVERCDGSVEIWPSQKSLAMSLGFKTHGAVSEWLAGRSPIAAKHNIASISRTELTATINPEAL